MDVNAGSRLAWTDVPVLPAVLLFSICFFVSSLIPPFQSPDEGAHIKRAYLLARGQFVLHSPQGQPPSGDLDLIGGMVDSGLVAYVDAYYKLRFAPGRRVSADEVAIADGLSWTGAKEFSPAYQPSPLVSNFPGIYLPQALGLALGEGLGLSIDRSYRLSRFMALSVASAVLGVAFSIYSPSALTLSLLVIPMSIFQMSSASIDGVATAVSILAVSIFMKIASDKQESNRRFLAVMAVSVFVVASSRQHLSALVFLIVATFYYTRKNTSLLAGGGVATLLAVWSYVSHVMMGNGSVILDPSPSVNMAYYLAHPGALVKVLVATWTNKDLLKFYFQSFLGVLGWLDARFADRVYLQMFALIVLIACVSISFKKTRDDWPARVSLLLCGMGSVLLVFLGDLIFLNRYSDTLIHMVQGRYFLVPALLVAYALDPGKRKEWETRRLAGSLLLAILVLFSVSTTTKLLLGRYYIPAQQPVLRSTDARPDGARRGRARRRRA